jgi:putative nucleotidyltransferase with HDIG domain
VTASLHPAAGPAPRINSKLLDALAAEGMVHAADMDGIVVHAKRRGLHVEEALIQMGLLDEMQLLKFQANYYKTYFVSSKKLQSAPIHDSLLKLITHKLAAKLCVFPVKFDSKLQELSILTVQPDDLDVLKNVQFATRVPKVRALVARPAAILAAIRFHFEGDTQAFAQIRNPTGSGNLSGTGTERDKKRTLGYEQPVSAPPGGPSVRESGIDLPPVPGAAKRPTIRQPGQSNNVAPPPPMPGQPSAAPNAPQPYGGGTMMSPAVAPYPQGQAMPFDAGAQMMPGGPPPGTQQFAAPQFGGTQQFNAPQFNGPQFGGAQQYAPQQQQPGGGGMFGTGVDLPAQNMSLRDTHSDIESSVKKQPGGIAVHDFLETMNVMIALLENERGDLRNHSVTVARITRKVCDRLGLKPEESDSIIMAAYLHDIGKTSAYHLTALNVAEYEAHRQQAKKSYQTPVRIFESVRLPGDVNTVLSHMYERYDGQGFPDRLTGKEICLGARVLSIVETYADLIGHAGNPFRKKLSAQEAWDVLAKYRGKVFDPGLVDVFKLVVLGDDLRAKLLADSRKALIIDPDAEETTVLELRLVEHGYDVIICRSSTEAENELQNELDVVISEVDLRPASGFDVLQRLRAAGNEVPFIFHSKQADSDVVQRGFELGADDFITKPASPDLVALKVSRVLSGAGKVKKKSGGVSGSLTEMALPDVVQILFHGRKSGKLAITANGRRGEILFCDGMIFDATFGEHVREEAFYQMVKLREGDFELDPNFRPTEQLIQVSPESLLLEGMRRLDEAER